MKVSNKELIQSYILTTAKYNYSVHEKRILYRIIALNQDLLDGVQLKDKHYVEDGLFESKRYTFPIKAFLNISDEKESRSTNHSRVKKALESLQKKIISYEDDKVWESSGIIFKVKMEKRDEIVSFYVADFIYNALVDFSKGYRKFELKVAMTFKSEYSMRFYELFSKQSTPISYTIEYLKEIFKVSHKYKLNADFIRYVVGPAKAELDSCSPYTFNYTPVKTGRKITSIRFIPIYQPQYEDAEIQNKLNNKEVSMGWYLTKSEKEYLMVQFEFTETELKNNSNIFDKIRKTWSSGELIDFLANIRKNAMNAKDPKKYIIGSLKKAIAKRKATFQKKQIYRTLTP